MVRSRRSTPHSHSRSATLPTSSSLRHCASSLVSLPTITLAKPHGKFKQGYQGVLYPKYSRYVDDAADIARIIRGEKPSDFSYEHDLLVQGTLLQACGSPVS